MKFAQTCHSVLSSIYQSYLMLRTDYDVEAVQTGIAYTDVHKINKKV
jgi:hypothetical protein